MYLRTGWGRAFIFSDVGVQNFGNINNHHTSPTKKSRMYAATDGTYPLYKNNANEIKWLQTKGYEILNMSFLNAAPR